MTDASSKDPVKGVYVLYCSSHISTLQGSCICLFSQVFLFLSFSQDFSSKCLCSSTLSRRCFCFSMPRYHMNYFRPELKMRPWLLRGCGLRAEQFRAWPVSMVHVHGPWLLEVNLICHWHVTDMSGKSPNGSYFGLTQYFAQSSLKGSKAKRSDLKMLGFCLRYWINMNKHCVILVCYCLYSLLLFVIVWSCLCWAGFRSCWLTFSGVRIKMSSCLSPSSSPILWSPFRVTQSGSLQGQLWIFWKAESIWTNLTSAWNRIEHCRIS